MELDKCKYQGKKVSVFKPSIDSRYNVDEIVSHNGISRPAIKIDSGTALLNVLAGLESEPDVVAVDEAFMIPGIAEALIWLYRMGINVIVSTLDLSASGKPFSEVKDIMCWATNIIKCSAVCTVCGKDAKFSYKKLEDEKEIFIGGAEIYEPRCWKCHPLINNA
jgi:Thymidine kinase